MTDIRLHRPVTRIFVSPAPYTEADGLISVSGIDLTRVSHLSVDGEITMDFDLVSANTLRVSGSSTSEVIAYTDQLTASNESAVVIGMSSRATMITDPREILRQRVIKALLSDERSDAFSGLGSGLDALAGTAVGSRSVTESVSRIRDVERSLIEAERTDEPLESSLSRINILGAQEESKYQSRLLIQIINKAGESIETEVIDE